MQSSPAEPSWELACIRPASHEVPQNKGWRFFFSKLISCKDITSMNCKLLDCWSSTITAMSHNALKRHNCRCLAMSFVLHGPQNRGEPNRAPAHRTTSTKEVVNELFKRLLLTINSNRNPPETLLDSTTFYSEE
jgi:hypothetical protein